MAHEHTDTTKPGERGYQPGCGCCAGPENDRCCCWMHQDISRGLLPHQCSLHKSAPDPDTVFADEEAARIERVCGRKVPW